jgi:hypothetical protein
MPICTRVASSGEAVHCGPLAPQLLHALLRKELVCVERGELRADLGETRDEARETVSRVRSGHLDIDVRHEHLLDDQVVDILGGSLRRVISPASLKTGRSATPPGTATSSRRFQVRQTISRSRGVSASV